MLRVLTEDTKSAGLTGEAYALLKNAILEGDYAPNLQISESELALHFGIGRTPIHEACLRLQEDGLLTIRSKKGIVISPCAIEDLREIYDVLIALESAAAGCIAELSLAKRQTAIAPLKTATLAMQQALAEQDLTAWGRADGAFHHALVVGSKNQRLARLIELVNGQSHRARMITLRLRKNLTSSIQEHTQIILALEKGDKDLARAYAENHRLNAKKTLIPLIENLGFKCF